MTPPVASATTCCSMSPSSLNRLEAWSIWWMYWINSTAMRKYSSILGARFDTVLIDDSDSDCECEETGIEGVSPRFIFTDIKVYDYLTGRRLGVAPFRVVFLILNEYLTKMGLQAGQIGHLVYMKWFSRPRNKDPYHGMYTVSPNHRNSMQCAAIIEVGSIFPTSQLVPRFVRRASRARTSGNVIDRCEHFLINSFIDHYTYHCI